METIDSNPESSLVVWLKWRKMISRCWGDESGNRTGKVIIMPKYGTVMANCISRNWQSFPAWTLNVNFVQPKFSIWLSGTEWCLGMNLNFPCVWQQTMSKGFWQLWPNLDNCPLYCINRKYWWTNGSVTKQNGEIIKYDGPQRFTFKFYQLKISNKCEIKRDGSMILFWSTVKAKALYSLC